MKAVVLRVDSPGGSAFASEVIRRECELTRGAGKPVVVSMGSVAASGGYWISTASDEIWAQPETITGSIGIFGIFPTVEKPLAKYLGVHTDGVGTTRFTDAFRPDRALEPGVADVIQQSIDHGYEEFLARVAEARKMTRDAGGQASRAAASGAARTRRASASSTSSAASTQAIGSAAKRAKLPIGYRVVYLEKEKGFRERVADMLLTRTEAADELAPDAAALGPAAFSVTETLRGVQADIARLSRWNDPRGIYAHCLCGGD